jgi:prevent-host-death family protein
MVSTLGACVITEQEKTPQRPAQRIGVREFRGNFSGFMRQVRHGASFIVTSRDEAVAIILPPQSPARPRRQPGTLRGKIHMAPDFDTLPAEILAAMEASQD